jgi:hypothetical protein
MVFGPFPSSYTKKYTRMTFKNEHSYTCVNLSPNFIFGDTLKKGTLFVSRKLYFIELEK